MKFTIKLKSIAWLAILPAAMFFSCSEELPVINQFESVEEIPTVTLENAHITYTEKGFIKGKLQAPIMQTFDGAIEPYIDFPNGISIVMYNEQSVIETSMTANRAIYYQEKKSWEAIGNVVISNVNGDILKTEKLYGDDNERKIFTNELVKITKADGTNINGESGFESNVAFTIYKFIDVNGRIFFKEEFSGTKNDSISNKKKTARPKPERNLPKIKEKPIEQ
jgi:LPS export ABC transporter protein LptC